MAESGYRLKMDNEHIYISFDKEGDDWVKLDDINSYMQFYESYFGFPEIDWFKDNPKRKDYNFADRDSYNFYEMMSAKDWNEILKTSEDWKVELDKKENIMKNFKIVDYKVYADKVVVVKFDDGTKEKAVCCGDDVFDLERGIEVCVMKHVFGEDKYRAMLRTAMKQVKDVDKAKEDKIKADEEAKARHERIINRKIRQKENKRKRYIADMKEAYLSAMKEYEEHITEHIIAESIVDDLK